MLLFVMVQFQGLFGMFGTIIWYLNLLEVALTYFTFAFKSIMCVCVAKYAQS